MVSRLLMSVVATAVLLGVLAVPAGADAQGDDAGEAFVEQAADVMQETLSAGAASASVTSDGDSELVVVEDGTSIDVPSDAADPIVIELATGAGVEVQLDATETGDFERDGNVAVAEADGFRTIAEPTDDGGFRLAVIITDDASPKDFSYDFTLDEGTSVVARDDGGFDFVDGDGAIVGGIAAPWGVDAAGKPVAVWYDFDGSTLVRHVATDETTVFPVATNWCMFGKNPNGSCRGSRVVKAVTKVFTVAADKVQAAFSAAWKNKYFRACIVGAVGGVAGDQVASAAYNAFVQGTRYARATALSSTGPAGLVTVMFAGCAASIAMTAIS